MNIQEIKLFIKETEAVVKMQHYLSIEILNDHIDDITKEIYNIIKNAEKTEEINELLKNLEVQKQSLEKELNKR